MKPIKLLVLGLFSLMSFATITAQNVEVKAPLSVEQKRECVKQFYDSQSHVMELTNSNDGAEINAYFKNIGLNLDKAKARDRRWCGAYVANSLKHCGVKCPYRNWAPLAGVRNWHNLKKFHTEKRLANTGDVAEYKFPHVEGVYERHPNPAFPYFTASGGNTSAPRNAGSNKEGVWKKTRLWRDVNTVTSLAKLG